MSTSGLKLDPTLVIGSLEQALPEAIGRYFDPHDNGDGTWSITNAADQGDGTFTIGADS